MKIFQCLVVYKKPEDFKDEFIVREQYIDTDTLKPIPGDIVCKGKKYEDIKGYLLKSGLFNIGRHENDVTSIMEVWI